MAQSDPNRVINLIYQQTIPISNSTEKQENVGLVLDSMEQLIKLMKQEDPLFACLYQEMAYSGSYWDGLRVKEATEFDLNIVFKLPCQFKLEKGRPAYARLYLEKPVHQLIERTHSCYQHLDKLSKLFEPDHATNPSKWFLMPNLVRRWTESLIDKTVWFNRAKAQGVFNSFNGVSKSGPAFTFKFHRGKQVDVDFVPSIYVPSCENFLQNNGFTHTPIWYMIKDRGDWKRRRFGLIPKPLSHTAAQWGETINDKKVLRDWRLDFKDLEKNLITDQRKPMIKLLKAFRDHNEPMKGLHSYALKMLVINLSNDKKAVTFREATRGTDFIQALEYLLQCLTNERIPSYWNHNHNVIEKLKGTAEIANMRNWLSKAITNLNNSKDTPRCSAVFNSYFANKALDFTTQMARLEL